MDILNDIGQGINDVGTSIAHIFAPRQINFSQMGGASTPPTATPQAIPAVPTPITQPTGNLSQINNNPGNLIYAGQQGATRGQPKGDGTYWAKFANGQTGMNAFQNDTAAKIAKNPNMTVAQLIDMRSPPSENNSKSLHYNVMDDLKDLKDSGVISTLMANKLMASKVPAYRLAHALAKAEGYYASRSPQIAALPKK